MDFSKTFIVYDIKVGRCSQPSEYLKLYEYQRSRSFIDLGLTDSTFSNFFFLETPRPIEAKFHVEPLWERGMNVSTNGLCYMTKMATMSTYVKNLLKSSSLEPKG